MKKLASWYDRHQKTIDIVLLCTGFTALFAAIWNKPYYADDLIYQKQWGSDAPVQTFSDVLTFIRIMYQQWSGRVVPFFIEESLFVIGKPVSALLETIAFFSTSYLMAMIAVGDKQRIPAWMLCTGMLYFFNPYFEETVLWYSGAASYLWSMFLILLCLIPAVRLLQSRKLRKRDWLYLIAAMPAGMCMENVSSILVLYLCWVLYRCWKYDHHFSIYLLMEILLTGVGVLIMITAPGNAARADTYPTGLLSAAYRGYGELYAWLKWLLPLLLAYCSSCYLLSKESLQQNITAVSFAWFAAATVLIMIASPTFPQRACYPAAVLFMTALISNLQQLESEYHGLINLFAVGMMLGLIADMTGTAVLDYVRYGMGVEIPH